MSQRGNEVLIFSAIVQNPIVLHGKERYSDITNLALMGTLGPSSQNSVPTLPSKKTILSMKVMSRKFVGLEEMDQHGLYSSP